jgi:dimethylaniline monooxygenase (N-oxide forming)
VRGDGGKGHVVEVQKKGEEGAFFSPAAHSLPHLTLPIYTATTQYTSRFLTIATGLHVIPQIPSITGIERVSSDRSKQVLHSSEYKSRSQLAGKRVLILGTGETGMDLAYASVKAGAEEVVLCSRGGFLSFPKALNNFSLFGFTFESTKESPSLPIDGLITNLFESCYVHPWVAASHLRWFVSDFVIKRVLWLLTGASCHPFYPHVLLPVLPPFSILRDSPN